MTTSTSSRWTLAAAVLGSGIVFLDSTVVNVALPTMGRELESSFFGILEGQSYVYYGYLLTLSALLILAGALADRYGRRLLFAIGLVGFGATSILCGLAPNMDLLILFRLLQGAAGALLVPGSLAIITSSFTGEAQGRAFGVWAGASAFTAILGPALGGFLIAQTSWRSVFLINVPLVLVGVWATVRHVPESKDPDAARGFDHLGAVLAILAIGGLTFGVIRGQVLEWEGPVPYVSLAVGAVATAAFIAQMFRAEHPLVPPELFRSRNFTVTNISTFVIYGALYVNGQFLALFLIGTVQYNELAFGIATIPGTLFLAIFSARFGALAARHGPRVYMAVSPALMALGIMWLVRFPFDSEPWKATLGDAGSLVPPADYFVDVLPSNLLFGIGLMIMVAPLTTALMRSIPVNRSGIGSAVNNAISRVGPQLMGALIFVAISASFYSTLQAKLPEQDLSSIELRQEIAPLNQPQGEVGPEVVRAANESSARSFHVAMAATAALCLLGAAVNGIGIRNETLREPHPEDPAVEAAPA